MNVEYHSFSPYTHNNVSSPVMTADVVNRIRTNEWGVLNTASYMIVYNVTEGGNGYTSPTANKNEYAGKMHVVGFDSTQEVLFQQTVEASMNIFGIYSR